jgi:hypothetical protein
MTAALRSRVRSAASSAWATIRGARPLVILAIGFAVFVAYAFPGYMSSDSVLQLYEARTAVFTNAHPPVMAAEWRILEVFVAGPILMLLLQGSLFLGGLYGLLRHRFAPRAAAVAAVCVLLFPPVMTPMAVIWKDSQMAAYLIAGIAALLSPRFAMRLLGLALVAAACAFRYNAAAAALPIIGLLFVWRPGQRGWIRYSIAGLAFVVAVAAAFTLNAMLTDEVRFLSPAYTDIVGVLAYEDHRSDEDLREVLRGTPLRFTTDVHARARALYNPRNSWLVNRGADRLFDDPRTAEQAAAVNRAWKQLVLDDPAAYLAHRTAVYAELLGLSEDPLWSPVYVGFTESAEQVNWIRQTSMPSRLQSNAALALGDLATETVLFEPYVYAAIAILLLALCCRDRVTLTLLVSGLAYEAGYFPTAATPDVRYSHWMTVCTMVAALLLFVQRARAGRAGAA